MKANRALVVLVLLAVPTAALAQAAAPPAPPARPAAPAPPARAAAPMPPMGPDPVGEAVFPPELILRHAQAIGLSAEQRAFVREQVRQAQQRFLDLQFQLEDARDALVGVLQQNQVNEAQALGQLERILDFERQIKTAQITLMIRLKNKLTPEQQARLRELRGGYAETPPPSPY